MCKHDGKKYRHIPTYYSIMRFSMYRYLKQVKEDSITWYDM